MKSSNRDDDWLAGRLYFNRENKRIIIKRPLDFIFLFFERWILLKL